MNKYWNIMGWKHNGNWDRDEIVADIAIFTIIFLVAVGIKYL